MSALSRRRAAVAAVAALLTPVALAAPAAASSTANEVVYVLVDEAGVRLVLLDLDSRRSRTLVDGADASMFLSPELSPDGERVAFVGVDGTAEEPTLTIRTVRRDGSDLRTVTTPQAPTGFSALDVAPTWSPDGQTLLFSRFTVNEADGTGTAQLLTLSGGGGQATPLPGGENALDADYSPDGSRLVVLSGPLTEGAVDAPVEVLDLATGSRTPLGVRGTTPAWSPDGGTIAYSAVQDPETGTSVLAVVPAAGGSSTVLEGTRRTDGYAENPSWSPDGESLIYNAAELDPSGQRVPTVSLWAVDRDGERAGRLLAGDAFELQGFLHGPRLVDAVGSTPASFTSVRPQRLLDTRDGTGASRTGRVGPAGTVDLQVTGLTTDRGAVPADATAVVLNVTATGGTAGTDVRVYPAGTAVPTVSNLNAAAGATVPNLVTVPVGEGGRVTLRNNSGEVHLLADIAGWYAPGSGDGFGSISPVRLLDTRTGSRVGPAGTVDLKVAGTVQTVDGRPVALPDDVTAVVLNVTGTAATAGTDVRVYPRPGDASVPNVSNLNLRAGQTAAGLVTVAVDADGFVRLRNNSGAVHLLADLAGVYAPSQPGRFQAASPTRLLDTRNATGAAPVPVLGGAHVDLRIAGARGIPASATSALVNLTATAVSASTDVRVFPAGQATPTVSNLNLTRGLTRANLTVMPVGEGGRVRIRNNSGSAHLIGDLAGWFLPVS